MKWSSFKYLSRQGLHNMVANRLMTVASVGVLTVCLIVTGVAWLFGANVDSLVDYLGEQNEMVVYLQQDATPEIAAQVDQDIRSISGIAQVVYVTGDEVLDKYKNEYMKEYEDLWAGFEEDGQCPFGDNYRVMLSDVSQMEEIASQMEQIPGVDAVRAPTGLSDIFVSVQRVINVGCWVLVGVLGLVSMVVISNTIRLTVFARRKEINIMKYVGATNGFIRFPFFVEGLASGLLAALLASGVVLGGYAALVYFSADLTGFWNVLLGSSILPVEKVWYQLVGGFLVFGAVIGSLGTASSIRKYLKV